MSKVLVLVRHSKVSTHADLHPSVCQFHSYFVGDDRDVLKMWQVVTPTTLKGIIAQ